jgi:PPOX class probable F420-dependent enzyme
LRVEAGFVIPSPERQVEVLASMPNAIVATIRPDGVPQLTPNWYLWTGEAFLISVAEDSVKVRHLRRDPRIVLCIDDVDGGDYVQVTGTAILVEGVAAREPTLALCRKYMPEEQVVPHWEALLADGPRVIIEVRPTRYQWHDRPAGS